jgi:arylsulfatase A-like enzyme
MKAILILIDSLNRHYPPPYRNGWTGAPDTERIVARAPNITRFAERALTFDNHWIGSAPCMPARRDMLTGRTHFMERDWGGLEPFDIPFPHLLRDKADVFCHMETDHYHYFHVGGENYHMPFNTWAFHRGQESDTYVSRRQAPKEPEHLGQWKAQYALNRTAFETAAPPSVPPSLGGKLGGDAGAGFPTPRTFQGAIDWLRANEGADDFLLWVEVFDPHEPFDCPEAYLRLYDDDWQGPLYNWSEYDRVDPASEATRHLRRQYAATLTMMDEWLGRLLDELERQNAFEDTLIILTTDHGHMLGEKGVAGKGHWHVWNEMAHIPLMVHLPGGRHAGERRGQLTQNVDIMPTLLDHFGVPLEHPIHGESWLPALEQNAPLNRRAVLYGWFGQTINLTDGRHTYLRAPARPDNQPLYRYFLTPGNFSLRDVCPRSFYDGAELGDFLPYTDYPVIRAPVKYPRSTEWAETLLFDIEADYGQTENLAGSEREALYRELLAETMVEMDAPAWQFERVGLRSGS